ncbi:hypothetical protein [Ectobacillus ponti]|uniref:Uncharacterized protein n=1 Tax=Ectobacillus ponti TaxID=2961894 RepID=A0AA42BNS9_9BACI|nr:hypothetical protein [Ectobacillus ponti]MCP8968022.1 hypothetical protein [Ectobacillus ponti]
MMELFWEAMFSVVALLLLLIIIGIPFCIAWGVARKSPVAFSIGSILFLLLFGFMYMTDNLLWPWSTGALAMALAALYYKLRRMETG